MIVITGPGRSETSFLAHVYRKPGFGPDVGGSGWKASIRLEDIESQRLNPALIDDVVAALREPQLVSSWG